MFLKDADESHALGVRIGQLAAAGTVVALRGDLGMGKSSIARGIARGLGISGRIPSPTFILVAEYDTGRLPFHHVDLYRLGDASELEALGLDEVMGMGGVVAVEWPDVIGQVLPTDQLGISLTEVGDGRQAEVTANGPRSRALLAALNG